jgi:hypothetical protein
MSEVEKARAEFKTALNRLGRMRIEPIGQEWDRADLARRFAKRHAQVVAAHDRVIAAVRAESVGHVVQCSCHVTHAPEECADWNAERHTDEPHTDPLCLHGLKRAAIIRAEARVEALEDVWDAYNKAGGFDDADLTSAIHGARAELERLREK